MRKILLGLLFVALPVIAQQFPYGQPPPMVANVAVGFQALAKTSSLSASTTSASVALAITTTANAPQVQVFNNTTGIAYVVFCASGATCTASAGSAGTATSDYPVAPGSVIVMTPPAGAGTAAAVLSASTGTILFTPGVGL